MNTQEISFDQREEDQPIVFTDGADTVSEGCLVQLEADGVEIYAKVVKTYDDQTFEGEVTGFPGSDVDKLGDLRIGSPIRIQDRNIFQCAA